MFHTTNFARIGRTRRARLRCGPLKGTGNSSRASRIRWSLRPQLEWLERRTLLSGTTFSDQQSLIEVPSAYSPWVVTAADMDGDGDQDLLYCGSGSRQGRVVREPRRKGQLHSRARCLAGSRLFVKMFLPPTSTVMGIWMSFRRPTVRRQHSGVVAWYENVDGLGTFGSQLVLRHFSRSDGRPSIRAADLDR